MQEGSSVDDELRAEDTLALDLPNDAQSLVDARDRVRAHLHEMRVDEAAIYAADLTLEELVGNTLRYGYDAGARGRIRVRASLLEDCVRISIADDARAFDPTRHPEPPRPSKLHAAPIGGRGISMVRRAARSMTYRRESGENRIVVDIPRRNPPS
jgi:anti-sigma regulatory factor (Ser/Thr protein kinase)